MDLSNYRKDYDAFQLSESDVNANPFIQFKKWFQESIEAEIAEPNAFVLSTCLNNKPSSRVVLLKNFNEELFTFYTNYNSRKGNEIETNPNVSMLFFWHEMQRQVRIEGVLSKGSEEESNQYFLSRPQESQWSAIVSAQSQKIKSRSELEIKLEQVKLEAIKKPEAWGGYHLKPSYFEFWQGRKNRLHDRISYQCKEDMSWEIFRLAP